MDTRHCCWRKSRRVLSYGRRDVAARLGATAALSSPMTNDTQSYLASGPEAFLSAFSVNSAMRAFLVQLQAILADASE